MLVQLVVASVTCMVCDHSPAGGYTDGEECCGKERPDRKERDSKEAERRRSFEQFQLAYRPVLKGTLEQSAAHSFTFYDIDFDGYLTAREVSKMVLQLPVGVFHRMYAQFAALKVLYFVSIAVAVC